MALLLWTLDSGLWTLEEGLLPQNLVISEKLYAARECINLGQELGLSSLVREGDSKQVVNIINHQMITSLHVAVLFDIYKVE